MVALPEWYLSVPPWDELYGTIRYQRQEVFVRRKKSSVSAPLPEDGGPIRKRILGAAFKSFTEKGYADTSTLEIATRAKVSKRDLYASVGDKRAVLVSCITSRTARMQLRPELPVPRTRRELASILNTYATRLVSEVSQPTVIAMFRLAIAEAIRSPEIAQALEAAGRDATRGSLIDLFRGAQSARLIGAGNPSEMATQYIGLLWEDLMVSLLLGLASPPSEVEIKHRAAKATAAFLHFHPKPSAEA
jgi:AcrR family transcriptional regulator